MIKDSSSDVSPRESSAPVVADRRRQRRGQRSETDQQHDNPAFAEDEQLPPRSIDRVTEDDEEEANVRDAERLAPHVTKEHRRAVNEIQQQNKKPKKKTAASSRADDDPEKIDQQLGEQLKNLGKRIGDADQGQPVPVEPLTTTMGTVRDKSLEGILERARRARTGQSIDEGN